MRQTRDHFRKIRDTKGTFHAKMGTIKDKNGMELTEAEDVKKKQQGYTEELYKKDLHDPDNHDGVITHIESSILQCEVKWALGSITMNKASGGDGIPAELFQILKADAVKVLHSVQQIVKNQQWPQDWKKVSFHSDSKERQCQRIFKLLHNYTHFTCQQGNAQSSPSQASTVCKPRTSRCSSWIQKKQRNQRSNCQHLFSHNKAGELHKNIYFCFTDYTNTFECVDHNKLENSSRVGNTRAPYLPPEKPLCRSRSNS